MSFGPTPRCEFHDQNMTIGCWACAEMLSSTRIATLEAELARAKELAVWAVEAGAWVGDRVLFANELGYSCDGTPAGILAALEMAKGESK